MSALTQDMLKRLLRFDPESGHFQWNEKTATHTVVGSQAGGIDNRGYWRIRLFGQAYAAHRLAWFYVHGDWPKGDLDHINGNRTDNRLANLREVTRSVNMQNLRKGRKGLLGVRLHKSGLFEARIVADGTRRTIGYYGTEEEAHAAYLTAKRQLHQGCTI